LSIATILKICGWTSSNMKLILSWFLYLCNRGQKGLRIFETLGDFRPIVKTTAIIIAFPFPLDQCYFYGDKIFNTVLFHHIVSRGGRTISGAIDYFFSLFFRFGYLKFPQLFCTRFLTRLHKVIYLVLLHIPTQLDFNYHNIINTEKTKEMCMISSACFDRV